MQIRFAKAHDIEAVMAFIDQHWAKGHILGTNRGLMDWQHHGTEGRDFDFVLAANETGVCGVLGFILTSRYDPDLAAARTIWLALWKVIPGSALGLGMQLLSFLDSSIAHEAIGTVGINDKVANLYRALGYQTGTMRQWYVLHPEKSEFRIALVPEGSARVGSGVSAESTPQLVRLDAEALGKLDDLFRSPWIAERYPHKSARFFKERYLDHPFYQYWLYAIERGSCTAGLLALRICDVGCDRSIRLVDGALPPAALPGLGAALQSLLVEFDAECADLFESGLDADSMSASGMLMLGGCSSDLIVPNYYEPFLRSNVKVSFAYRSNRETAPVVFKADADQDRPNRMG